MPHTPLALATVSGPQQVVEGCMARRVGGLSFRIGTQVQHPNRLERGPGIDKGRAGVWREAATGMQL